MIEANKQTTVALCNGRTVDPDFLEVIYSAVFERIPMLSPNMRSSLKAICGRDFWSCLSQGEKRRAGWCMAHLVTMGELPLMVAESRHEYPVHYQLK